MEKPIAAIRRIAALIACTALSGCTWVALTPAGQGVRLIRANEVGDCERTANVNAKTADRVLLFSRTDRKIREELDALARNQAAEMGGDAIAPIGDPVAGKQSFDVYRCHQP